MGPDGSDKPVAELAERLRSLSAAQQLQVLREALRASSAAPDEAFRAAAEKVLREDREILDSLAE
jgi:hypothetical protein